MDDKIIDVIKSSTLFDEEYYLEKYEDIGRRNNDPFRHFIRHGFKEGRNPNAFFDTKFYRKKYLNNNDTINPLYHYLSSTSTFGYKLSDNFDGQYYLNKYPDVLKSGMNPLIHYMQYGILEGRKTIEDKIKLNHHSSSIVNISKLKISILIPVYNAIDDVIKCIDSVIKYTPLNNNINVLVLNDCSPDKNVKYILNKYNHHPFITVKHNFRNKGYTRNVNKGIQLSKERDVILLNSDTIVTPNWIRNLSIAAYSQQNVGTVTAVSNGAGAFSVPKSGLNDIPDHLNIDAISRVVSSIGGEYIDVPTGNGFCLYIKRDLINDIGSFDEKKFPKGYGEENDFCMRALNNGWHNIIDTKTYIFHKRSASFKESKHALMDSGLRQVKKDYPEYEGAIKAIGGSNTFKNIRESIEIRLNETKLSNQIAKPKLMFVISTRTGGTPKTNLDLMNQLSCIYDCYALACNTQKVEILKAGKYDYQLVEEYTLNQTVKYATHYSSEYESLVGFLLYKYNIDLLHIRHLAWHSLKLPQIAKELYIPVVNSFHDFYTICPSVNLIDSNGVYHPEGVVEGNLNPLWHDETVTPMTEEMLSRWKKRMANALSYSDHFITTCESAKDILLNNLKLESKADCFSVISHGRDFISFIQPKLVDNIDGPLKVLVPGNITHSKGSELIKEIKNLDIDNNIEFHIIGSCDDDLIPFIKYHGRYKRDDFQQLVKNISPHIAAVFSIWPETYCHTLTESWASGLPVVGIDYGAVGERIRKHKAGWLIKNDVKECIELLISIRNNTQLLIDKQQYVLEWQSGYGKLNTVSNMTEKYINIYQNILKSSSLSTKRKLGFIMKGDFPEVPPTAYVRLVDWKNEFEYKTGLDVMFSSWRNLLTRDLFQYEEFIIQRDAIPSYAVDWCINILKKYKIPYVFEMDDNLLEVPEIVDPEGVYKSYKPYLVKLLKNANKVHVTNESLKYVVENYNKNITVRPNKIFDHRWKVNVDDAEKIDIIRNKDLLSIVYFGSRTHQEDLNFIIDVVEELNKIHETTHLYVIGCGDFETKQFITRIVPPSSRYDIFVDWMTKIAHNFDIGVAPLVDVSFSKNKSYLKCLELNKLNIPVICSNVLPYVDIKELNLSNVYFSDNLVDEWSKLIKDFVKYNIVDNSTKVFAKNEEVINCEA